MKYDVNIVTRWLKEHGFNPVAEYKFHPARNWKFDFAFPDIMFALEVEGGVWTGGRHTRGAGFMKDMEKYNEASLLGWRILRCVPQDLCMSETVDLLRRAHGRESLNGNQ